MRYILLLALPLAACGSPSSDNAGLPETEVANDIAPADQMLPTDNQPATNGLSAPGSPTLPDDLIVSTNEPFWQARISRDAVVLTGIDQPERRMEIVDSTEASDGRVVRIRDIRASDARGTVNVVIRNTPCEDSMSGARFPFSGSLSISGRGNAEGCARLASAPPPREPAPEDVADTPRIPAAYVGRWGKDRAACRNPASSIEGLTISPRELRFHESLGIPTRVTRRDADTIAVTSAYEGEGMEWTATQTLRLGDGDRLIVTTRGESFERVRCG